jgi:hypothetical protein
LRIVASQTLGEQGSVESAPVFINWGSYYNVPTLPIWALIVLLLVVPKQNRRLQAWLILIPLGLIFLVWDMPARLFNIPDESTELIGFLIVTGVLGWSIVPLIGHWLEGLPRAAAFFAVLGVMLAVGLASACLYHFEDAEDLIPLSIIYIICVLILMLSMVITSYFCGQKNSPPFFFGWLLFWVGVLSIGLMLSYGLLMMILIPGLRDLGRMLIVLIPVAAVLGGIIYLVNLPFLVLAFNCPFYKERFENIFYRKKEDAEDRKHGYLLDESFSTEPTGKPVAIEDVVGRWQFYLDSAAKTVVVDFKPDGTFSEEILPIQGRIQECPGGTWKLEGPKVHLEGYVTAAESVSASRTWWMIDLPSGLGLFGGDGAEAKSFFRLRRRK